MKKKKPLPVLEHRQGQRETSEQEARRFIRSMSGRASEIAAISRAAEAALADMAGQERIAGWNDG